MRFIAARYDLTFPVELSREVIAHVKELGLDLDVVWLPCGHYTTGELPWKALDAWKVATFFQDGPYTSFGERVTITFGESLINMAS